MELRKTNERMQRRIKMRIIKMTINICYYFTRSKQRTQRETNEEVRSNIKKEN